MSNHDMPIKQYKRLLRDKARELSGISRLSTQDSSSRYTRVSTSRDEALFRHNNQKEVLNRAPVRTSGGICPSCDGAIDHLTGECRCSG